MVPLSINEKDRFQMIGLIGTEGKEDGLFRTSNDIRILLRVINISRF